MSKTSPGGGKPLEIAFFYLFPPEQMPPYVRQDYESLAALGRVRWHPSQEGPGWRRGQGPTGWWPSPRMIRLVRASDVVVQWFATPCAPMVAAWLCRKPSLVFVGGFDVACMPDIGYGRMIGRRTRVAGQLVLNLATKVLPFSRFSESEARRWAPRARTEVLHLGFDAARYRADATRERRVLTVGAVRDDYVERKGLDTFARTSRELPDVPFVLAGKCVNRTAVEKLRDLGGDNLVLTDFIPDRELDGLMSQSAVYAQLSLHEGFGCAVAEAMLSGGTPVVSNVGSLPEVVGDGGYYVPPRAPREAAESIAQALEAPRGAQARERIAEAFPLHRRQQALRDHVLALTGRN